MFHNNKSLTALLIAAVMALTLTACGIRPSSAGLEAETKEEPAPSTAAPTESAAQQTPAQSRGEYELGGLRLEIEPEYNELITVETPENDPDGILISVSETASLAAGGYEGAGWLFSLGKVSADRLHEMLCYDMSGAKVFAKDAAGNYYVYYHPTDVRYVRATNEEMQRDSGVWSMLCEWASGVPSVFAEKNGLESVSYGNSEVEMLVARAAWANGGSVTLSTTEFGPLEIAGVDGTPYAELVMQGFFDYADMAEAPDGEYVVLNFPDENTRLDFFFANGSCVRIVSGDTERFYQATQSGVERSFADTMRDWYHAAALQAGVKTA